MEHSASGYANHRCRCGVCTEAHATQSKAYRAKNLSKRQAAERRHRAQSPESQRVTESRVCERCGREFKPWNMGAAKLARLGRFCSISCSKIKDAADRRSRQSVRGEHPLANAQGRALVHRVALFNTIGPGSHPCHWCGRMVTWTVRIGSGVGSLELVVDHLDGDFKNNAKENLVASCNHCNTLRAYIAGWIGRTGLPIERLVSGAP